MSVQIKTIPSFLLKGVDPKKLYKDYEDGVFNRPVHYAQNIKLSKNNPILAPIFGKTMADPVFAVSDRFNNSIVIATTNHVNVERFLTTGVFPPDGGRCDYCKQDFTHKPIGYPIAYDEKSVLTGDTYKSMYYFWTEGEYCSYECALGDVRRLSNRSVNMVDASIYDAERLLHLLYKLQYPDHPPLLPSSDPKLLKANNGSLTTAEWRDGHHLYQRTDGIFTLPGKVTYERTQISADNQQR